MSFQIIRPLRIEQTSPHGLQIQWSDGLVTQHTYRQLRFACACAVCQDELTGERRLRPEQIPDDIHPLRIVPVGNYALRFNWNDGHDLGLYSYQMLRDYDESPSRFGHGARLFQALE